MTGVIHTRGRAALICGLTIGLRTVAAQFVVPSGPDTIEFRATADSVGPFFPQSIGLGVLGVDKLEFRLARVRPGREGGPDFIVVSPSSGVAPATVVVGLNPNVVPYLPAGGYTVIPSFEPSPPGLPPGAANGPSVRLTLTLPPPPTIAAVVSAATLQPTVSPGEVVSIFGANIGSPSLSAKYGSAGLYPTELGNSTITFNGVSAPLLYVSTNQINAVVPYAVAGQKTADVVVTHHTQKSPAFSAPILDTSPGIFTVGQSGSGQGAILNNQVPSIVTFNSVDNPAAKGSVITFFATGTGLGNRTVQDGSVIVSQQPLFAPAAPVSLTVGGQPATILYAGGAPYQVSGMLQVNAIVPDGIGSGPQPIVLTVGENSNSQQNVTVAVQ